MKKFIVGFALFWAVILSVVVIATTYQYDVVLVMPNEQSENIKVGYNQKIDASHLDSETYEVVGWYYDEALQNEFNIQLPITGNVTLYAKTRSKIKYSVFLNTYQGNVHEIEVRHAEIIGVLSIDIERPGYRLLGWYEDVETTMPFDLLKDPVLESMQLYAKWEAEVYTIRFMAEGRLLKTMTDITYGASIDADLVPSVPEKLGYTVTGWDKDLDFITGSQTVNAIYTINQHTVFMENEGETVTLDFNFNQALQLPTLQKTGYDFLGWYRYNSSNQEVLVTGRMPDADLEVFARWQIKSYTVVFVDESQNEISRVAIEHGEVPTAPAAPDKMGYRFVAWDTDLNTITGNVTISPLYEIEEFNLYYDDNHRSVVYNQLLQMPVIEKTGHHFLGWYYKDLSDNEIKVTVEQRMPASDVHLYSKWEKESYDVHFIYEGEVIETQHILYGENAQALSNEKITRPGYRFLRYEGSLNDVRADRDIVLVYTPINHLVTFENDGQTESVTVREASQIIYPSVVKPGYDLLGWFYKDSNGQDIEGPVTMPNYDLTLRASWKIRQYQVRFVIENESDQTQVVNHGSLPNVPQAPEGYVLEWSESILPATEDKSYHGTLVARKYQLTLILDNEQDMSLQLSAGAPLNLRSYLPTRENYLFLGWKNQQDDSDWTGTLMPSQNLVIIAQWRARFKLYIDDVSVVEDGIFEGEDIGVYLDAAKEKVGHTFINFYLDAAYTTLAPHLTMMPEREVRVYAKFDKESRTVIFISDGIEISQQEVLYQESAVAPTIENTPVGYHFTQWDQDFTSVTENITVEAVFARNIYNLRLFKGSEMIGNYQLEYGMSQALNYPNSPGEKFIGWYDSDENLITRDLSISMGAGDLDLYATYIPENYYRVDFNSAPVGIISVSVAEGQKIGRPSVDPTRTGYTFEGWYKESQGTTLWQFDEEIITSDVVIYAKWQIISYEVKFIDYNNEVIDTPQMIYYKQAATAPILPERLGYEFIGWDKAFNEITENTEVRALYRIREYVISYIADGGTHQNLTRVTILDEYELLPATKAGYTFVGWFDSAADGNLYERLEETVSNLSLYARYQANSYQMIFNANGGSAISSQTVLYNQSVGILSVPTRTGYTFAGWFLDEMHYANQTVYKFTNNITLMAVWEINVYIVEFDSDGGSAVESQYIEYGDKATTKFTEKDHYEFIGWYQGDVIYNFDTLITSHLVLKAVWRQLEFTVVYEIDAETTHSNTLSVFNSSTQYQLLPAIKTGYQFVGWFDQNQMAVTTIGSQDYDLVLEPEFELATYQITYHSEQTDFSHNNQKTTYQMGDTYQLLPAQKQGYIFTGWYLSGTPVTDLSDLTGDLVLQARFEKEVYQITYTSSVEDFTHPNTTKETYQIGDTYQFLPATKTGYQFIGWQLGTQNITSLADLTGDIELKALFSIVTYDIYYHLNQGSNAAGNPTQYTVETTKILDQAAKAGYAFTKWFLDEYLTIAFESFANHTGRLDLYAGFDIETYQITYEFYEGEINDERNITSFDVTDTFEFYPATKKYHTFIRWQDENGETISNLGDIGYRNVNLVAIFERDQSSKTITYNLQDVVISSNPSPTTFMVGEPIELLAPMGAGYEFVGWYLVMVPGDTDESITTTLEFNDDVILYAVWSTALVFNLSYETDTSQIIDTASFAFAQSITLPTLQQPQQDVTDGQRVKTFAGWYLDEERTIPFEYTTMPAEHITVYAKWDATYMITFVTGVDNYEITSLERKNDDLLDLPSPASTGLTFLGFYLDQNLTISFNETYMPPNDLILYLSWETTRITVTYITNIEGVANVVDGNGEQGELIPYNQVVDQLTNEPRILSGWYLESNFRTLIDFETYLLQSNISLYAKWDLPATNPDVTVDQNNGNEQLKLDLNWNDSFDIGGLTAPQRQGYVFLYFEVYNSQGESIGRPSSLIITDNFTIVAVYEVTQVTVTVVDGSTVVKRMSINYGTTLADALENTSNQISKPGYEVKRFYNDEAFSEVYNQYSLIEGNTTIYVEFELALYQVTFNTGLGTAIQTRYISYNGLLNLNESEYSKRDGYRISGWQVNGQLIQIDQYQIRNHTTITVVWTKVSYQFILHDDGVETIVNYAYGDLLARPPMYERSDEKGYFAGWFLDPEYQEVYVFDRYMDEGTIRIYAKWVPEISAQYYLFEDGAYHLILQQEKNAGNRLNQPNMDRFGYHFDQWYSNQNMTEVYDFSQVVSSSEPVRLYGGWNPVEYEVKLNVENQSQVTLIRGYHQILNLPIPTKSGYLFKYWIDEAGEVFTRTQMPARNVELTAVFEITTYMLKLEANTGVFTVIENIDGVDTEVQKQTLTIQVPYGMSLSTVFNELEITRYAYLFDRWFEGSQVFTEEIMPSRNLTLRATYRMHFTPGLIFVMNQVQGQDVFYVTGYEGTAVNILIPDFMYAEDGRMLDVVMISPRAFVANRLIQTVTIGRHVKTIGSEAFMNLKQLNQVIMSPDSELAVIQQAAFSGANQLAQFNFPQSVEVIEDNAFLRTRLTKLLFDEDSEIREIGASAFAYTRLNEVTFSNKLTTIGAQAFRNNFLTSFVIPKTVRTIGANILTGNREITYMQVLNNYRLSYYFGNANNNVPALLSTVDVVDTGSGILIARFADNLRIQRVVLESSITVINEYAFNNARELISINLESVITIGDYGFNNTRKLIEIDLSALTTIGNYGFSYATLLRDVGTMARLETIGNQAFRNTQIQYLDLQVARTIGNNAFNAMNSLRDIKIYESIQSIGNNILQGSNGLETLMIPGRFTLGSLFGNARNIPIGLKEIIIAEGSTQIVNSFAHSAQNIETVYVPSSVTTFGTNAFNGARNLREVDLTATRLTTIPERTFFGTLSLVEVKLPASIHTIGTYAFYNSGIRSFDFTTTMHTIASYAFAYSRLREVHITDSITSIATRAFANMSSLDVVTIPSTFTPANNSNIFLNSTNVTRLTLPGSTRIQTFGFTSLPKIEYVEVSEGSRMIIAEWALRIQAYELVVPSSVETINQAAFREMRSITFIDLSKTKISTVPSYFAFQSTSLAEVKLPNTVKTIMSYAFSESALSRFVFPVALETIDNYAFRRTRLTSIIMPDTINDLGVGAFSHMQFLKEIRMPLNATARTSNNNTFLFDMSANIEKVTIPGRYTLAQLYLHRSTSLEIVEVTPGSTIVANNFLNANQQANYNSVKHVILPDSITSIGNNAFRDVTDLESIRVSNNLTSVGDYAFSNTRLLAFDFVSSLRTIGQYAFNNTALETAILNDSIDTISANAFANTASLREAYIPDARVINNNILQGSTVERITIPGRLTLAAYGLAAANLAEVTILEGITSIVNDFAYVSNNAEAFSTLRIVNLPDSVTAIGNNAFRNYQGTSFKLPHSLVTIGTYAFQNTSIQSLSYEKDGMTTENTLPSTLQTVGMYAFDNTQLREVVIPDVAMTIGQYTFANIASLTRINIPERVTLLNSSNNTNLLVGSMTNSSAKEIIVNGQRTLAQLGISDQTTNLSVTVLEETASLPVDFANGYVGLTRVSLPQTLLTIDNQAFMGTTSLTAISLPESITRIGSGAFRESAVVEIIVPQSIQIIGVRAFGYMPYLTKVYIPHHVNLEQMTNPVNSYLFEGSNYISDATLPGKFTAAYMSFAPTEVSEISLKVAPGTTSVIADYMKDMSRVINLEIPDSVISIGNNAFDGTRVISVLIPSNVVSIGNLAFANNTNMQDFVMQSGNTAVGTTILQGNQSLLSLTVSGHKKLNEYHLEMAAIQSLTTITVAEGSRYVISEFALDYTYLRNVVLPSSVTQIQSGAFKNSGLSQINLEHVTMYNDEAFNNTRLRSVHLSQNVISVDSEVFGNNPNLLSVKIDYGFEGFGNEMFKGSNAINAIEIPSNVTLSTLGISKDLHTLITEVTISSGTTNIVSGWLDGFASIENVLIANTVRTIGQNAFRGTSIESIVIPASVQTIQSGAFDTETMTEITFEAEVPPTSISAQAFNLALAKIKIKIGTRELYEAVLPASVHSKIEEI